MMLAGDTPRGPLRVALATTHLPLKDVPAAITADLLERILRILDHDLRRKYGIAAPRILVTGLNPHAPAKAAIWGRKKSTSSNRCWKSCATRSMQLSGPHPADTLFTRRYSPAMMPCWPCTTIRG